MGATACNELGDDEASFDGLAEPNAIGKKESGTGHGEGAHDDAAHE
jgi:hypothetical protein